MLCIRRIDKLRILFIGTVEFSAKALKKLLDLNENVIGVITKKNSPFNSDFSDLIPICKKEKIPYLHADDINAQECIEWISKMQPQIIFCFGWSNIIKKEILDLPPIGVLGFHPARLPENRGRHPIIWALSLGLKETASTFFFMNEGADSGDIISQENIVIDYGDNARTLYDKITQIAIYQMEKFIPSLHDSSLIRTPQNHSKANYWRKRRKTDGLIDFRMTSRALYNLIRALTKPYIGAHLLYNGEEIKVWKAREIPFTKTNIEPGKILDIQKTDILVKCYDNAILLTHHEFSEMPHKGEYLL